MQSEQTKRKNKINLRVSWELNHWCEVFNLRSEELREIVKKVGPDVDAVRAYLARKSIFKSY